MPFFSVVIPLFNKEFLVKHTINSLLAQSFTDFEVLIVNDGSTDKSLEIAEQLVDSRFKIINQENKGVSHARNKGIKESLGKYIALLDADDYWYKNHLLELRNLILKFPKAGLYCSNYEINYNNILVKPAKFNFVYNKNPLIVEDYFEGSIINSVAWTSSTAFTKMAFEKIGLFNTELRTGQDIDLWIRFALLYPVALNPKITMRYNNFKNNSLSKSYYNTDRYLLINNYYKEEKLNKSLKKYLDVNRYALAIRCLLNKDRNLYKQVKSEIDFRNLNVKQRTLLKSPFFLLRKVKHIQKFLIKKNVYINAYS